MRYAFVFCSIVAIWVASLMLLTLPRVNPLVLYVLDIVMTLVLFWIGFRGVRR